MSLFGKMKRALGKDDTGLKFQVEPPSAAHKQSARAAWAQALHSRDERTLGEAAHHLIEVEAFPEALSAYEQLISLFPQARGEYERWMGQIHYLSLAYRAESEGERIRCYTRALGLYLAAAEHGDREHEDHLVELLEHVTVSAEVSPAKKRENLEAYLRLFPQGQGRERAEVLLEGLAG